MARITERMFGHMKTREEGHELTVIGAFYEFFGYILEHGRASPQKTASGSNT